MVLPIGTNTGTTWDSIKTDSEVQIKKKFAKSIALDNSQHIRFSNSL